MRLITKKFKITIGLIALVTLFIFYQAKLAPTKIGLINYPEFLFTKIAKSNESRFVSVNNIPVDQLNKLERYDMLIVFGMGIRLSEEGEKEIVKAGEEGTKIYLQASTNPRLKLTNLEGEQLDNISEYLSNAGSKNYRNMLNYIRKVIDEKSFMTDEFEEPQEIASDVLFHVDEEVAYEKVSEFEDYCLEKGFHKPGAKKVVLFTSIPGPFNTNRDHMNSMIKELEGRGLNVYPIAAFRGRLSYMQEIKPDLVIYMPHGRISMGGSPKRMEAWLKELNVPVLCPVSVFNRYDDWLKDKQGMFGGLLSQSVTMPEFDGGIVPYAVFAQFEDENGYLLFKQIPGRLQKFGDIAEKYIALADKTNQDKKLAIVYFKGPGKNSLVAANLEVLPSLHNMLLRLRKEGYDLGNLPEKYDDFENVVMKKGPVLGPYAEGAFDKYLKNGDPELILAEEYEDWCHEMLPAELYEEVERRYGKAPGSYMSVYKNEKDYLAVARVKFGNVVLLPQPLPGLGKNEFQLIHGAKVAPPHAYIAPYFWIQKGFKADAIFHFGTHGSLEFTPGKQIALSDYDWTDPLIGTAPHFYVYTISNVGEGMIAKRRSYGVLQTYLTPPFIEAKANKEKDDIRKKMLRYEQAKGSLKAEYALNIKKLLIETGLNKDLDLDSVSTSAYTPEQMMDIANYLEEIEHEKITGGLYTMNEPYSKAKLDETIRLMYEDVLAYNMAEIDIIKGKISRSELDRKAFFNEEYLLPAKKHLSTILKLKNDDNYASRMISKADMDRAASWKNKDGNKHTKKRRHPHAVHAKESEDVSEKEKKEVRKLMIKILPDTEKTSFLNKQKSEKEYEKTMGMFDPSKASRIKRMAKMIPAMEKALNMANDSTMKAVLHLMKKEELRELALQYLDDKNLLQEVEEEKKRQDAQLLARALSKPMMMVSDLTAEKISNMPLKNLEMNQRVLSFYQKKSKQLIQLLKKNKDESAIKLSTFINGELNEINKANSENLDRLTEREKNFAAAVSELENSIKSVLEKRESLKMSPEYELRAIVNSLNGGYTPPSPGGDPVTNPATVATGRNLYAVSAEHTPSKEAWEVGKKLGNSLIDNYKKNNEGNYPQKIGFTLWSASYIETEGTTIAQILYMLGVEPVWDPFGRVKNIRLIPAEELGRPRIDAVVQTSGQLRDLAASRLFLINKAISMVAEAKEERNSNFVAEGMLAAEKLLIEKGFSPKEARKLSKQRIFGGVNGNYGTGIMGMVESSDRWDSTKVVAQTYINNMGASYGDEESWGDFGKGVFEAALLNTDAVVQPRQSNTWGALSLDHVYEFMGGLNLAVKEVTGKDPDSYFNDFRNSSNPRVQGLKEAIWVESRTTLLNPRYIKEYMQGGASSAESFAETFRNTFGWNVMKPTVIENRLWDELYDTYVQDKKNLNVHEFFKRENPYALQEMTAIMLETVRKGMWKASQEQIDAMAKLHTELVKEYEAGCSGFVCDNQKLRGFISQQVSLELSEAYNQQINTVREAPKSESKDNVVLKKEEKINPLHEKENSFTLNTWVIFGAIGLIMALIVLFIVRRRRLN
ncbi:cobaltochelatase subunit CobN [Marinifilum caeruleilacunae]|uniref:Cobaltochelatase subunit CobN n=1 Tax=Marinifilum caeruleilacunae TaxID=2499076 RepID=A0ABX1WQG8_9BACT|nr:cobaltochelatase subunit CobN [Marinifilum caeruleilacunae]NOU58337.1 cobaltochelatase subunit CobN [Marinifilum caeruleilacunae]